MLRILGDHSSHWHTARLPVTPCFPATVRWITALGKYGLTDSQCVALNPGEVEAPDDRVPDCDEHHSRVATAERRV